MITIVDSISTSWEENNGMYAVKSYAYKAQQKDHSEV